MQERNDGLGRFECTRETTWLERTLASEQGSVADTEQEAHYSLVRTPQPRGEYMKDVQRYYLCLLMVK